MNATNRDNLYSKRLANIEGYHQERKDRAAHGGGVALYIREPIQYTRRTDLPSQDLELNCVDIEPPKSKSWILIASFDKFEIILSSSDQEGKEIILLGDTNYDFANNAANHSCDMNKTISVEYIVCQTLLSL